MPDKIHVPDGILTVAEAQLDAMAMMDARTQAMPWRAAPQVSITLTKRAGRSRSRMRTLKAVALHYEGRRGCQAPGNVGYNFAKRT